MTQIKCFDDLHLFIDEVPIECIRCMKYLGLLLEEVLSFDKHVDYLHNKVSSRLGMLRRSREFLDINTSPTLYKSLVLPHFGFSDTVYGVTYVANLDRLQKL